MQNTSRHSRFVLVIAICLTVAPSMAGAADETERTSLKGLVGVSVLVEHLPADIEGYGLTTDAIKTAVELRLRRSGIQVFSAFSDDPSPALACVYVNINLTKASRNVSGLYAASVAVELEQWLRSVGSGLEFPGTTWKRASVATVGEDNLRQLRNVVDDKVDEFINDYLAANPKSAK